MTIPTYGRLLLAGASLCVLAACGTNKGAPPPAISYDSEDFKAATAEADHIDNGRLINLEQWLRLLAQH